MLYPLIPDIRHPKWIIAFKILEIIGSIRAKKIAGNLKVYDVDNFILNEYPAACCGVRCLTGCIC